VFFHYERDIVQKNHGHASSNQHDERPHRQYQRCQEYDQSFPGEL